MFKKLFKDESGAVAIEYVIITSAMGFALLAVMPALSTAATSGYSSLASNITSPP